jgi:hypothetical protein
MCQPSFTIFIILYIDIGILATPESFIKVFIPTLLPTLLPLTHFSLAMNLAKLYFPLYPEIFNSRVVTHPQL